MMYVKEICFLDDFFYHDSLAVMVIEHVAVVNFSCEMQW